MQPVCLKIAKLIAVLIKMELDFAKREKKSL